MNQIEAFSYTIEYCVDLVRSQSQKVKEIWIPSIKLSINYTSDGHYGSVKKFNIFQRDELTQSSQTTLKRIVPVQNVTKILVSKSFVDQVLKIYELEKNLDQERKLIQSKDENIYLDQ